MNTAELIQYCEENAAITVVVCIFVMGGLLICFWDDLDKLRNLVLIVGVPLAIGLAVWAA